MGWYSKYRVYNPQTKAEYTWYTRGIYWKIGWLYATYHLVPKTLQWDDPLSSCRWFVSFPGSQADHSTKIVPWNCWWNKSLLKSWSNFQKTVYLICLVATQTFLIFTPNLWRRWLPFDGRAYFSHGLVKNHQLVTVDLDPQGFVGHVLRAAQSDSAWKLNAMGFLAPKMKAFRPPKKGSDISIGNTSLYRWHTWILGTWNVWWFVQGNTILERIFCISFGIDWP